MKHNLISFFLVLASVASAWTFTLNVPGDYETIQAAIIWAEDGDTVLVADGWYFGIGNRGIEYLGKEITVKSENGPRHTIIDCEGLDRAFKFYGDNHLNPVLDGFTIIRGHPPTEELSESHLKGAGILAEASTATIKNCIIYGCSIQNDTHHKYGGGCYLDRSDVTLINCKLTGNILETTSGYKQCEGAGICIYNDCTISLTNCTISDNAAICISGNASGGGIYVTSQVPRLNINHCTIVNNVALDENTGGRGGGLTAYSDSMSVTSSIIYGNLPDQIYGSYGTVTYSDIEGGWSGEGNISLDPLFIGGGDYHLTADSPCIDTGIDAGVYTDIDGHTRPAFDGFDMGSDEYVIEGLYLDVLLSPTFAFVGQTLDWKIGLTNLDSDPVTIDAARLDVEGPITASVGLWSGFLTMDTGEYLETWLGLTIPPDALLGTYTFTTVASYQGRDLASDSFECEITD